MRKSNGDRPLVTRRSFIHKAVVGAGAAAAALGANAAENSTNAAVEEANVEAAHPIRTPEEFAVAKATPLQKIDFPMTGAQVFAQACKEEGVAAMFCCPG